MLTYNKFDVSPPFMIHPKTTTILAKLVTQNANLLWAGFFLDSDIKAVTPPKCWTMTNKTTKIPESMRIITSKDVQLFDKSPFIILSKPWQVPVEGTSN